MKGDMAQELFFQLIQVSMGNREKLERQPTETEWMLLYNLAIKQAISGVLYKGIEQLPAKQKPPKAILLKWFAYAERIKEKNELLNSRCIELANQLSRDGFKFCILKGQGLASLYPYPEMRTPGDIDVWLNEKRKIIINLAAKYENITQERGFHHVRFACFSDVEVEMHFMPSWICKIFKNSQLQKFFKKQFLTQAENKIKLNDRGDIPIPNTSFNAIYVLLHIYRHFFREGVGLRQLMDYYYVLSQPLNISERESILILLKKYDLYKFAGAVFYVLHHIFLMEEQKLFIEEDKRRGIFLIREIMETGNFGFYDDRANRSFLYIFKGRFVNYLRRNISFIKYYPSESFFNPLFHIALQIRFLLLGHKY